jgi:RNA polymerase sporulation-specific sigma factor
MIFESFIAFFAKVFLFTSYVASSDSFPPPLSAEEEKRYLALCKSGDTKARDELIRRNLRLVAHVVKKYAGAGEADDLISVGTIGLIKGINTFDETKTAALATYCAKCVDNEILMYIRANKKHRGNVLLSDSVGVDKDGNEITLMDVLPGEDERQFLKIEDGVMMEKVRKIIETSLSERERLIITLRYGLGGEEPLTQLEVSEILNISRSYVSRLEKKIMKKIRRKLG